MALVKSNLTKIASPFGDPHKLSNGVVVYNTDSSGPNGSCFGFVNGNLYIGSQHHALIIYNLIDRGIEDWDSLINAQQKWGWLRVPWNQDKIEVILTSDEASQDDDSKYSQLLLDSLEEFFHKPAEYDEHVGSEGYSNASQYGERSKVQYFGEGSYCDYCDEYYPESEEEKHIHTRECSDCGDEFNPNDEWEYETHNNPYCTNCGEHYSPEYKDDHDHVPPPGMPPVGSQIYWEGRKYIVTELDWEGMFVKPDPSSSVPAQYNNYIYFNDWKDANSRISAIAHCQDLMDERVFAILSADYVSQIGRKTAAQGEWMDWDQFVNDYNRKNGVPDRQGNDAWNDLSLYDPNSPNYIDWNKYDPFTDTVDGVSISDLINNRSKEKDLVPLHTQDSPQTAPQVSSPAPGTAPSGFPDDTRLLDIVKNPKTLEYRWSYDGHQLHIWRVFNRNSYGPSHYDMFGGEGYSDHSQGRVYVSPSGQVGVLYWQISHPECEEVLHEWVQKEFGKDPDFVYRAYGPYAGEVRPRWSFPIVEVSGLPIRPSERWWENPSGKPKWWDSVSAPTKYPAKKKKITVPGPVDQFGNPIDPNKGGSRGQRRRKRRRNRKYRNRSFGSR